MIYKSSVLKSGFLLIEAIVASVILSCMILCAAQYQWHIQQQTINIHIYTSIVSYLYDFLESKETCTTLCGTKKYPLASIEWNTIPIKEVQSYGMVPIRITVRYSIKEKEHIYTLYSMVQAT